jgi:putative tryptophan/tyrosine transport system substrate-binding protein
MPGRSPRKYRRFGRASPSSAGSRDRPSRSSSGGRKAILPGCRHSSRNSSGYPSDVLVVSGVQAVRAARQATKEIPIVIASVFVDPVSAGFVASLAHPGGNVTGLASQYEELVTKQVQLLGEMLPGLSRLAILRYEGPLAGATKTTAAQAVGAAKRLGARVQMLEVGDSSDVEAAFRSAHQGRAQAMHVLPSPFFNARRLLLVSFAARFRLPALYEFSDYVRDGGLMSYGVNLSAMFRRAANFVDRILTGAKPSEIPIETPTRFELVINLKTVKTLGLTTPPSVLARADQIIE